MIRTTIAARSTPDGQQTLLDPQGKPVGGHVDSLTEWLRVDEAALVDACVCITEELNEAAGLRLRAANLASVAALQQASDRLGERLGEGRYWTWLSGRFSEDCRMLQVAAVARRREIAERLPIQLRGLARPERSRLVQRRRQAVQRCDSLRKLEYRLAERLSVSRTDHCRTLAELRWKRIVLRHDQTRVGEFDAQMALAYAEESRRICGEIGAATRAGEAAVALANLCRLRLTRDTYRLICPGSA